MNTNNDVKQFNTQKYYLQKGLSKKFSIIINEKNFYDQAIDSDIKRYKGIRKLTTGQVEDYTTEYLLDHGYTKNHYNLTAVDLNRQKN